MVWKDTRSGQEWLVEALPFDLSPIGDDTASGWTLMFVCHDEHRTIPVGHQLGAEIEHVSDTVMAALLDAALPAEWPSEVSEAKKGHSPSPGEWP